MTHIYKATEWESAGYYYCGDVSAVGKDSNKWWYPCNILNLSPVEYVKMLINKFNAVNIHYTVKGDVLIFCFTSLADCRKYKNYLNKVAREKNFTIY